VAEVTEPGRLAVVDDAGNVVVMDGDGSNRIEVAIAGEEGRTFAQPIWSPDGSLVSWAQAGPDGFAYVIQDPASATPIEVTVPQYPFYAYWSPAGESVGLLRNGDEGVVFELVDVDAGRSSVADTDTPYYFSWEPAGEGLVAHAGATGLVNRDREGAQESLEQTSSGYLAPQWIPQGILHVDGGELVLDDAGGDRASIADVGGLTTFVANEQGTLVAIQVLASDTAISVGLAAAQTIPQNSVVVVDISSGEVVTVSSDPALAFSWSPNGRSLLVLGLGETRGLLAASVWSDGEVEVYASYAPSPVQVRDVFPFFPQYAQSLSFWSADSRSFALVGEIGEESGVWVQQLSDEAPDLISDGTWAAWSS
jgi:hypothetical protein